jgi:hypothetical protein
LLLIVAYNTSHHQQIKHGVVIWGSTRWTQFGYATIKTYSFTWGIVEDELNLLIAILETIW